MTLNPLWRYLATRTYIFLLEYPYASRLYSRRYGLSGPITRVMMMCRL